MNDVKLENVELQEEEVNIYTPACGETRYKCIADCLMGNCFITCDLQILLERYAYSEIVGTFILI